MGKVARWMRGERQEETIRIKAPLIRKRNELLTLARELTAKPPHTLPAAELAFLSGYSIDRLRPLGIHMRRKVHKLRGKYFRGGPRFVISEEQRTQILAACDAALNNGRTLDIKYLFRGFKVSEPKRQAAIASIVKVIYERNMRLPPDKRIFPRTKSVGGIL